MELFLTIETQVGAEYLSDILRDVKEKLIFVTDTNANLMDVNNYGTEFGSIAVIPSCVSDDFWEALGWKERKQIWRKKREADIRLRMNYDRFVGETPENQRLLFIQVIVESIRVVISRSKGDFQGEKLISDILRALNVTLQDLDRL